VPLVSAGIIDQAQQPPNPFDNALPVRPQRVYNAKKGDIAVDSFELLGTRLWRRSLEALPMPSGMSRDR
jgi:hypothetical protein